MNTTSDILTIGDGTHPVKIQSSFVEVLRETMTDREIRNLIRRFGPTTRPITKAKQVAMALENQSKELPIPNPGAWRFRHIYHGNSYESGYCRHRGKWTQSPIDPEYPTDLYWHDEAGNPADYNNAEFWPA